MILYKQDKPNVVKFPMKMIFDTVVTIVPRVGKNHVTIEYNLTNYETTPNETVEFNTTIGIEDMAKQIYLYFINRVGLYNVKLGKNKVTMSLYSDNYFFNGDGVDIHLEVGTKENSVNIPLTVYDNEERATASLINKYSLETDVPVDITASIRNVPLRYPIRVDSVVNGYVIPTNDTDANLLDYVDNGILTNIESEVINGGGAYISFLYGVDVDAQNITICFYNEAGECQTVEEFDFDDDFVFSENNYPRADFLYNLYVDETFDYFTIFYSNTNVARFKLINGCEDLHTIIFLNELGGYSQIVMKKHVIETSLDNLNTFNTYSKDLSVIQNNLGNKMTYNHSLIKVCDKKQTEAVRQLLKSKFVWLDDMEHPIILDKVKVSTSDDLQTIEIPFHYNYQNLS